MRIYRFAKQFIKKPLDYAEKMGSIVSKLADIVMDWENKKLEMPITFVVSFTSAYNQGQIDVEISCINMDISGGEGKRATAGVRLDTIRFTDNGYSVVVDVSMPAMVSDSNLFVENNLAKFEELKKVNPQRYGHIDERDMREYLIGQTMIHELVHAFDPELVENVRKHGPHKTNDAYKKTEYFMNPRELEAFFSAALQRTERVVRRAMQMGYSDTVRVELVTALQRLRARNLDFSGLGSLAIPLGILRNLFEAGKSKEARMWLLKIHNEIQRFVDMIDASKK